MPQLPIHESQQSIATQRTGPQPVGGATYGAKVLQGFGKSLENIGDAWHKAHVTNQYTTAKNQNEMELNQLMADADEEVDHLNRQEYLDRLNEISGRDISIDDAGVRSKFEADNGLLFDIARLNIEGSFKKKMITHQLGEIDKDANLTKSSYINSESSEAGNLIARSYLERLQAYKDSGYLTDELYLNQLNDMTEWEELRVISDIGKDPEVAMQKLKDGHYGEFDVETETSLINTAKASVDAQRKMANIGRLTEQGKNETEVMKMIYTDPTRSLAEKVQVISEYRANEGIREKFAINATRILQGTIKKIKTNEEAGGDLLRMFPGDVHGSLKDITDDEEYQERLMKIRDHIQNNAAIIDNDDKRLFLNEIDTISTIKKHKDRNYNWRQASKYFDETLPQHMRNKAMMMTLRKAHIRGDGRGSPDGADSFQGLDLPNLLRNVSDEVRATDRKEVDDMYAIAREKVNDPNADLRYAILKEKGTGRPVNVILQYHKINYNNDFSMIDGKPSERLKRLKKPKIIVDPDMLEKWRAKK